jgi:antitoxin MazE
METSIIKIGNSKGIIIPKRMLDQLGGGKKMDIQLTNGKLLIAPIEDAPRRDWESAFSNAVSNSDLQEENTFENLENEFDNEEWSW